MWPFAQRTPEVLCRVVSSMQRSSVVIAVLLVAGLAGCLNNESYVDPANAKGVVPADEKQPRPPRNATNQSSENTPPTAVLTMNPSSGTAPLAVNITVDGRDPDGDAITWTLDLNGDGAVDRRGDAVPANVLTSFGEGNHTVVLTVKANNQTDTATAVVAVRAPKQPTDNATEPGPDPVTLTGGSTVGAPQTPETCIDGLTSVTFAVESQWIGWRYNVTAPFVVLFYDAGGEPLESSDGAVPPAATSMDACHDGPGPGAEFTLTLMPNGAA